MGLDGARVILYNVCIRYSFVRDGGVTNNYGGLYDY
jgi:hypothetical protein